jgi:inward rectifier potassium channel
MARRPDVSTAVRRGVPSSHRRDLYAYFMAATWPQILLFVLASFIVLNLGFATAYWMMPGSVDNVEDGNFFQAFVFSVQTMAAIGYGVMAPQTTGAHVVVVVEAFMGLLCIALATGLVFARASRPRSSVMFSNVCVVNLRHGVPTLTFRVGNARGNEIVSANVKVAVLLEEESVEGHKLHRLHDLKLDRAETPMFALSWSVFHQLNEQSPLHGLREGDGRGAQAIIVSLIGHDSTFAQTTHSRHMYSPEDIRVGHRFVDVISDMPDGRILIDFERFHDTISESHMG